MFEEYAKDVRRELFISIPALRELTGYARFRAQEEIEREVEQVIQRYIDDFMGEAEPAPEAGDG